MGGDNMGLSRLISIHALRAEGDVLKGFAAREPYAFQSTPSVRRATIRRGYVDVCGGISIHALRAEGDCCRPDAQQGARHFNPRPPCGGRPACRRVPHVRTRYFNPRPPCGGRQALDVMIDDAVVISIHALRAEGD